MFRIVLRVPPLVLALSLLAMTPVGQAAHTNPAVIATIENNNGTYSGVGVNSQTNRIYAVRRTPTAFAVDVIDGISHAFIKTIALEIGEAAGRVEVNTRTGRVYVVDGFTTTLSIIDGNKNTLVDSFDSDDVVGPIGVAVNPETNRVYQVESTGIKIINGDRHRHGDDTRGTRGEPA